MRNIVLQTGMVFNKREVQSDKYDLLFFLLSVSSDYRTKAGEYHTNYDFIQCMYAKPKGEENKKYELIKERIQEKSVVMIDGFLRGYYENLKDKYEGINDNRYVLKNILYINRFMILKDSVSEDKQINSAVDNEEVYQKNLGSLEYPPPKEHVDKQQFLNDIPFSLDV